MGFIDYKTDLQNPAVAVDHILDKYFHTGQSAIFSGAPPGEEANLKETLAGVMRKSFNVPVHPIQMVICGSAHLGFSPVPDKLGKPFDSRTSDIDVCIVSSELFEQCWTELQSAGLNEAQQGIVSKYLFLGFIHPASIKDVPGFGLNWWNAFGGLQTERARAVRGRLYKNFWCMNAYHSKAVTVARRQLNVAIPNTATQS